MKITNLSLYLILNCKLSTVNCKLVLHPPFSVIEEIDECRAHYKHHTDDNPKCGFCCRDERKDDIHTEESGDESERKYY